LLKKAPALQEPFLFYMPLVVIVTSFANFHLILNKHLYYMDTSLITTSTSLDGYKVIKHLGVVRGITVRSRSALGNIAGGLQSLFGGRLSIYVEQL
jgi:hypothetical protein